MQTRNSPKKAGNYNKWNNNQRLWMLEWATNHLDYWLDGSYTHIARYMRLFALLPLDVFPHKALQNVTSVESQWKSMLKKYASAIERLNSSGEGLRDSEVKKGHQNIHGKLLAKIANFRCN